MIMGTPAKVVRSLAPEQIQALKLSAQHYIENAKRFKSELHKIA